MQVWAVSHSVCVCECVFCTTTPYAVNFSPQEPDGYGSLAKNILFRFHLHIVDHPWKLLWLGVLISLSK